jgi:hypothetical protein
MAIATAQLYAQMLDPVQPQRHTFPTLAILIVGLVAVVLIVVLRRKT